MYSVAHICAVLIRFSAWDVYFTAFTSRECAYSKQGVYEEPGVNFFLLETAESETNF